MTTGSVSDALEPVEVPASETHAVASIRGTSDFDVTVLTIDLAVPAGADCLFFDFRFATDETPERVLEGGFHDAFVAEVGASTWTTDDLGLTAPDNFAFDGLGNPISLDKVWPKMTAEHAAGTAYDRATPLLRAWTPAGSNNAVLYLSIFDEGDAEYDSAVLLDHIGFGQDLGEGCEPGVTLVATKKANVPSVTLELTRLC